MNLASQRRSVSPRPPPSPTSSMMHQQQQSHYQFTHGGATNKPPRRKPNTVTFDGDRFSCAVAPSSSNRPSRLRRQFSTSRPDDNLVEHYYQQQQPEKMRYNYPHNKMAQHFRQNVSSSISRSCETSGSGGTGGESSNLPLRNNSYPTRRHNRNGANTKVPKDHAGGWNSGGAAAIPAIQPNGRRSRPKPPPLNFSTQQWDSGQTSETDCSASVASSTSPPRSSSPTSIASSSSTPPPPPIALAARGSGGSGRKSPNMAIVAPAPSPAPLRSPRSTVHYFPVQAGGAVDYHQSQQHMPLSPIPHSPQPGTSPYNYSAVRASSPYPDQRTSPLSPRSPRSPCSPYSPGAVGIVRSPSPHHPPVGNLARLASRRRSNAVPGYGMRRRTSNFLELPETDYERQRRYCSLPEHGYNPRHYNEIYRLRAFSISPKGALIKHGDQLASRRRSKSSNGSTANTSKQPSRTSSRGASPYGSRDVSPMARSPTQNNQTFSGGCSSRSPWSSHQSGLDDPTTRVIDEGLGGVDDEDLEEEVKYRVCMLGQNATGKTALVNQFLTSEYMNTYDASLEEFDERSVSVVLDGEESELVFIDHTNGEMSVENTLSTYEPHACVIVYSVVDRDSFQLAEEILAYLWRISYADGDKASVILVGNKVDLERSRVIPQEEGRKMAMSFGAKFIETSVGIQHNVDELLVGVLKQIRLREQRRESRQGQGRGRREGGRRNKSGSTSSSISSPLHTLQVARDILTRVCLNSRQNSASSKSCENLHVL